MDQKYKKEIWKSIPDFSEYEASNLGRIKRGKRILKGTIHHSGYRSYTINKKSVYGHILVFSSFFKRDKSLVIDHIDNNKLNNNIKNLQQITQSENVRKYFKNKPNKTGFTGVYPEKNGKFRAYFCKNGKLKYIGTYKTPEEAHKKYLESISLS